MDSSSKGKAHLYICVPNVESKEIIYFKKHLLLSRTGISGQVPQGTGWKKIEMSVKIKHASYDLGYLWLVTETGFIVKCTK